MPGITTAISPSALDVNAAIASAASPDCGALGVFVGTVRSGASAPGRRDSPVVRLDYEAHPTLAPTKLQEIAAEAARKWDLRRVVAVHRTGECTLGEPSVVVVCAAPHRADALDACRWIIDEIKGGVPIWKREVYADGSDWVEAEGGPDEGAP
jgi:molybdopterin synthase catalytic subunit